jgi:hypothetical protein
MFTNMSNCHVLGIDPGAHGALAFIDYDGSVGTYSVTHVPPLEILQTVKEHLGSEESHHLVAYLERVGGFIAGKSLPGSAMFKLGHSAGYWEGMLAAMHIRTVLVRPQEWQKGVTGVAGNVGPARKRALRDEAIRLFPGMKVTLDNCDALLIANYGLRIERGAPTEPAQDHTVA